MTSFDWQWLIAPLVGALIGLITNGIAIRMLFRPFHAVKIGNFTLPFTPGLIPKEKPRIAHSVGVVVANQLVNADVLERGLINADIDAKITDAVSSFAERYKDDARTLREVLSAQFGSENTKYYTVLTENKIVEFLYVRATRSDIGAMVLEAVRREQARGEKFSETGSSFSFKPMIMEMIGPKLAETVNDLVREQGFGVINHFVETYGDKLLDMPLSKLYAAGAPYLPQAEEKLLAFYHHTVKTYLPGVLAQIDIAKLVEERINAFSLEELEKLLLDLMRKELAAIVYLGGLLGAIMGLVMNFI